MHTAINLPKTAMIAGRAVRLKWQPIDSYGWFAEISPRRLRELERDNTVHMGYVEDELRQYGDRAIYGMDRNGKTWLCVYATDSNA